MIEQSTLLKLARDYANRKSSEQPSLKAIVLIGSVARNEPPLGDAVDLDILLIGDFLPEKTSEIIRLSDNVFIDAQYVATSQYIDRKAIRVHHFTSAALNDALILYDPRHYFDILQASVRAPYNRTDHIYDRARSAYNAAIQSFDPFLIYREDPPENVTLDLISTLQSTLTLTAHSLLPLVSQTQSSSTGIRKLMVRFEAAANELNPELYSHFLEAFGAHDVEASAVEGLLNEWLALYKTASKSGSDDPLTHPLKRGYYDRGIRALIESGHAINSLLLMEVTMCACARRLDPLPDTWSHLTHLLHKSTPTEFSERVRATELLLDQIDQTLIRWADREGLEH